MPRTLTKIVSDADPGQSPVPTIFVDADAGTDDQDDGSLMAPFATISAALAHRMSQWSMDEDVVIYVNGATTTPDTNLNQIIYEERLVLTLDNFRRTRLVGYGAAPPIIRHETAGEFAITVTNLTAAGLAAAEGDAAIDWTLADTGISWNGPDLSGRDMTDPNGGDSNWDFGSSIENFDIEGTEGAHGLLLLGAPGSSGSYHFISAIDIKRCWFKGIGPSPGFAAGYGFAAKNAAGVGVTNCLVSPEADSIIVLDSVLINFCANEEVGENIVYSRTPGPYGDLYIRAARGLAATEGTVFPIDYSAVSASSPLYVNKLVCSQDNNCRPFRDDDASRMLDITVIGDCHLNDASVYGEAGKPARSLHVGGSLTLADTATLDLVDLYAGALSSTSSGDSTVRQYHIDGNAVLNGGGGETWTMYTGYVAGDLTLNGATWDDPNGGVGGTETP